MASFQDRVIGALKLQASTFEEVENDPAATAQAATVVAAVALARAVGGIIYGSITVFLLTIESHRAAEDLVATEVHGTGAATTDLALEGVPACDHVTPSIRGDLTC